MKPQEVFEYVGRAVTALYGEIKGFFGSPVFFILLGCAFLYMAGQLLHGAAVHPSFIFLLAILGVSIVLYGTGTHGVGTAEMKDFPIKVAVAGGAGVLAAIFGYGVIWKSQDIEKVFKTTREYAVVVLKNETKDLDLRDLTKLRVSARAWDGRNLHVLSKSDQIEILLPVASYPKDFRVCVTVEDLSGKSLTEEDNCSRVNLDKHDDSREYDELTSHVARGKLPLKAPKLINPVDEAGKRVEPVDPALFTPG